MSEIKKLSSLRNKVLIPFIILLFVFIVMFIYTLSNNMFSMIRNAEQTYINEQMRIVLKEIDFKIRSLNAVARKYSSFDETKEFVSDKNADYINKYWKNSEILKENKFDFVIIKDMNGNDLYSTYYDNNENKISALPEGLSDAMILSAKNMLDSYKNNASFFESVIGNYGFFFYNEQAYFANVLPILGSNESGEPVGTMILGFAATESRLKNLIEMDATDLSLLEAEGDGSDNDSSLIIDRDKVKKTEKIESLEDKKVILLEMQNERVIFRDGLRSLLVTGIAMIFVLLMFVAVIYFVINNYVIAPIFSLSTDVDDVAKQVAEGKSDISVSSEFYNLCVAITENINMLELSRKTAEESNVSIATLKSILNGIDARVYVSDIENDELLFMNSKMESQQEFKDVVGKICYKTLKEGQDTRCATCSKGELLRNPDKVVTWEEHDEYSGRHYKNCDCLLDWPGGKKVMMKYSSDITELKIAEEDLKRRLDQQELMTSISQSFLSNNEVSSLIGDALKETGIFMDVDRVTIIQVDKKNKKLNTYQKWFRDKAYEEDQMGLIYNEESSIYKMLESGTRDYLCVSDYLESETEGTTNKRGDVRAMMLIPIFISDEFWGVLCFTTKSRVVNWTASDITLGKLIANVISGVISGRSMQNQLLRLSAIVDSSPISIMYISIDGKFEYFNDIVCETTGYSREELQDSYIHKLFNEEEVLYLKNSMLPELMKNGQMFFELPITCKNGERRMIAFSDFFIGSDRSGFASIGVDMTEMHTIEKELIKAKEDAEKSSQAKGEFLSRMSHEMRTPLNAVIGITTIAKNAKDNEKYEEYLDKIDNASKHLLGVINDILDMSKIEANKFELSSFEFDFEKMIEGIVNVICFRIDEKRQILNLNIDRNIPKRLIIDEQRLKQVIINLLSNSVKFTPEKGTITLSAKLTSEENDVCTIRFDISDNGIGISEDSQTKLFRSFEQGDGGIARRFGGTGLGLAISKHIVEMMEGNIWLESQLGKGAVFSFDIKCRRGIEHMDSDNIFSELSERIHILAVEDSHEARDYMSYMFESLNLRFDLAPGGVQAIDMIKKAGSNPYNIMFIDLHMPDMDGIELSRHVKEMLEIPPEIILISSSSWNEIKKEAEEANITRYLQKPIMQSSIIKQINNCFGSGENKNISSDSTSKYNNKFKGKTLLLAEDIEINREIIIALLENSGITVECAENGCEAVEKLSSNPEKYHMIFMDIHMPEMDGYEATKQIRALSAPYAKQVPIVAMTANVFKEDMEKCLAVGMNAHIGKPINIDDVFEMLSNYIL